MLIEQVGKDQFSVTIGSTVLKIVIVTASELIEMISNSEVK